MHLAIVNPQLLLAFTVAVAVISAVPGPGVLFIIGRALSVGRPAALAAAAGNSFGSLLQGIVAAFGLGAVLADTSWLSTAVRVGGAIYLVGLGVSTLRHRGLGVTDGDEASQGTAARRHAVEGCVVGLTNPKTLVFLAAMLPQFVDPARGHVIAQMLVLLVVYGVVGLVGDAAWGYAGGFIRTWAATSPRRIEALIGVGGACIAVMGVSVAVLH